MSDEYPRYTIYPCTKIGACENARGEDADCVVCDESIDSQDDHWHLFYYEEDDSQEHIGDLCRTCQRLSLDEVFGVIREKQSNNKFHIERGLKEYRQMISHAEVLERHIQWLNGQIESLRHGLDNRRAWAERYSKRLDYGVTWFRTTRDDLKRQEREKQEAERRKLSEERKQNHSNGNGKRDGYVYLILSEDGHYKIGRTKDVPTRSNTLGVQLPYQIEVIHSIKVNDMVWAERHLHEKFAAKRVNGEWFSLESDDVEWIKALSELQPEQ
jgi:predicted GIY-YIG superfamily endonuclease